MEHGITYSKCEEIAKKNMQRSFVVDEFVKMVKEDKIDFLVLEDYDSLIPFIEVPTIEADADKSGVIFTFKTPKRDVVFYITMDECLSVIMGDPTKIHETDSDYNGELYLEKILF